MKCPQCAFNQKYKSGMTCGACGYRFALDPKEPFGITDMAFKTALDRLSGAGQHHFTPDQLYSQIYRLLVKKKKPGLGALSCLGVIIVGIGSVLLVGALGLKLMGSVEKGVLKAAMADLLPRPIIDRPKSGMMVPVRFWMRGEMRRYARRLLSKRNLARVGFFNADYVRKLLDYDRSDIWGSRHGLKLWMLVTFMLWHEQMVEGKNAP
jgi:hypothetical protein